MTRYSTVARSAPSAGGIVHSSRRLAVGLALIGLSLLPAVVSAQITVNRSIIEFTPDSRVQDIEIANNGDFRVYLDVTASEILDPDSKSPTRKLLDDPRTAAVIASPRQLLLPPGERKRLRVILRDVDVERERVFRLAVKPYTGKVELDNVEQGKKHSAVKILVGYDLLLISRPRKLEPKVDVTRTADSIEFRNLGNTSVLLRNIKQCDSTRTDCVDLEPNRLYVGETYKVSLPKKGPAEQWPVDVVRSVALENTRDTY